MKTILFLTQNLLTGGVQKSIATLVNEFCKNYQCVLVLLEDNKAYDYFISTEVHIHTIPILNVNILQEDAGDKIFSYRKDTFEKYVKELQPDLIYSHEDYHNILSLHIKSRAKRLLTCHLSIKNFYTDDSRVHLMSKQFYFENIKKLYPKADHVVCVSKFIENEIYTFSSDIKTTTIYNGIKQDSILDLSLQTPPLKYEYILHVGRLHRQKGQLDLIYAYYKVHQQLSQKLVFIGDGPSKEALKDLVHSLELDEKIIFLGNISEPYHYMKNASFCVTPSYQEGFSIAALEIMLVSALLSSRYNGYQEIFNDYGNLFNVSEIESMATLLKEYALNKKKVSSLKKKQSQDIVRFKVEDSLVSLSKIMQDLLNNK